MNDQSKDEFDTTLTRLFAEKNESLPGNAFIMQLLPRLERAQRAQQLRRVILIVAVLLVAAFLAPLAVRMIMGLFLFAERIEITPTMNSILMVAMAVVTFCVIFWSRKRVRQF